MNKGTRFHHFEYIWAVFKKWNNHICLLSLSLWIGISTAYSQTPYLLRSTLGNAGTTLTAPSQGQNYSVLQSIGQGSAIGTFYQNGYVLRQGFIQPQKKMSESSSSKKLQATIFPNPAAENMSITLTGTVDGPITVNLFDICGKKLYTNYFPATQEIKLNYQWLAAGIYIMEVNSGTQYFSTKLIKE